MALRGETGKSKDTHVSNSEFCRKGLKLTSQKFYIHGFNFKTKNMDFQICDVRGGISFALLENQKADILYSPILSRPFRFCFTKKLKKRTSKSASVGSAI